METAHFKLPAMYADHHVMEVRRVLSMLPGVEKIYASSAFHVVEVAFDQSKLTVEAIEARLEEAGYLGDLSAPVEAGTAANGENGGNVLFRHTAAHEAAAPVIGFAQTVSYTGPPLWPCPGIGVIRGQEEETIDG